MIKLLRFMIKLGYCGKRHKVRNDIILVSLFVMGV